MTDILTRLAALTAKDENGLLPCPNCSADSRVCHPLEDDDGVFVICGRCAIHTQHKPHGAYPYQDTTEEEAVAKAISDWNSRPREAALIALVQEAAAEIERLRKLLLEAGDYLQTSRHLPHGEDSEYKKRFNGFLARAKSALDPQEPTS